MGKPASFFSHGIVAPMASEDVQFDYSDGALTGLRDRLFDDQIITVSKPADADEYTIYSLGEGDKSLKIIKTKQLPQKFLDIYHKEVSNYLQHETTVLISTLSGTGLALAFFDDVLKPFLDGMGIKYNVVRTKSVTSVKEFAATLGTSKHTVVALTGDGGTVDILNGVPEIAPIKPDIVLIPLGTANALFHSTFGISLPPYTRALRTLLHGTPKLLPNFTATFSKATLYGKPVEMLYGAAVASYGFHASLVYKSDTPELRKHGAARFGMVAQEMIANPQIYKGLVNGKEGAQYAMATLVRNLEHNYIVARDSKPLDGVLWFIFLKDATVAFEGYKEGVPSEILPDGKMKVDMVEEEGVCCVDGLAVVIAAGGWMEVKVVDSKVNLVA